MADRETPNTTSSQRYRVIDEVYSDDEFPTPLVPKRDWDDLLDTPYVRRETTPRSPSAYTLQPKHKVDRSSSSPRRRERMPDRYDGKSSWLDYWAHFRAISEVNQWTQDEAACHLASSLREGACRVLYPRPLAADGTERNFSLRELVARLNRKYGPDGLAENYLSVLKARRQQKGESLHELADEIEKLCLQAYPEADSTFRERLTVTHFKESIGVAEVRAAVHRAHPKTLDDAVSAALDQSNWLRMEATRDTRPVRAMKPDPDYVTKGDLSKMLGEFKQNIADMLENKQTGSRRPARAGYSATNGKTPRNRNCWTCGSPGHRARECPQRQQQQGNYQGPHQMTPVGPTHTAIPHQSQAPLAPNQLPPPLNQISPSSNQMPHPPHTMPPPTTRYN